MIVKLTYNSEMPIVDGCDLLNATPGVYNSLLEGGAIDYNLYAIIIAPGVGFYHDRSGQWYPLDATSLDENMFRRNPSVEEATFQFNYEAAQERCRCCGGRL